MAIKIQAAMNVHQILSKMARMYHNISHEDFKDHCHKRTVQKILSRNNPNDKIWLYGFAQSGVYHSVLTDINDRVLEGGGYASLGGGFQGRKGFLIHDDQLDFMNCISVGDWIEEFA